MDSAIQILSVYGEVAARSADGGGVVTRPKVGVLDSSLHRFAIPLPVNGEDLK